MIARNFLLWTVNLVLEHALSQVIIMSLSMSYLQITYNCGISEGTVGVCSADCENI